MQLSFLCAMASAVLVMPSGLWAQNHAVEAPAATTPAPEPSHAAAAPEPVCTTCIPALLPIEIELDTDLGSKISKTGDTFAFHLAKAIVINGREVVAAGVSGQGEVIHAKKAGGSGTAGELVLAARFLLVGSQHLRLRSMRLADKPADTIGKIDAFNAATVMSPVPVALVGFALTGRNTFFPKGTIAVAKTAEPFPTAPTPGGNSSTDPASPPANPPAGKP